MARSDSALILFTLTPEAEGARKPLGLGRTPDARALYASLIEHAASLADGLTNTDLLIACEARTGAVHRATEIHQRGRDFGESLGLAIEDAFALGYRRVVVIGNDSPDITTEYLSRAFARLAEGGEALRRSEGAVLVGNVIKRPDPAYDPTDFRERRQITAVLVGVYRIIESID